VTYSPDLDVLLNDDRACIGGGALAYRRVQRIGGARRVDYGRFRDLRAFDDDRTGIRGSVFADCRIQRVGGLRRVDQGRFFDFRTFGPGASGGKGD
jgi:hypothetical protein